MKHIFILSLLFSFLFSWEKQIILGSYSVESNGERALETLNKEIAKDIQLQGFMQEYSLKTGNRKINNYTAVSISPFDSYTSLLNIMYVLKVYYPDIYAIDYPAKSTLQTLSLTELEEKVTNEVNIEETAGLEEISNETRSESQNVLIEEDLQSKQLAETSVTEYIVPESEPEEEIETLKYEIAPDVISVKEKQVIIESNTINEQKEQTPDMPEYIFYLIILAALALSAAGITVFKMANSKTRRAGK